jgi:hypothetical protein
MMQAMNTIRVRLGGESDVVQAMHSEQAALDIRPYEVSASFHSNDPGLIGKAVKMEIEGSKDRYGVVNENGDADLVTDRVLIAKEA